MTSIERTAYPRFKAPLSRQELTQLYTPTVAEIEFTRAPGRNPTQRLTILLLLKTFQHLGYFPTWQSIPTAILQQVRSQAQLPLKKELAVISAASLYRYYDAIRTYLGVKPYMEGGSELVRQVLEEISDVLDNPADLINAVIEELIHQRFELPAFSTLDRLVNHFRTAQNEHYFALISTRLTTQERSLLDQLPVLRDEQSETDFSVLKQVPGSPTLSQLQLLEDRLHWLQSLFDVPRLLHGLARTKIRHFAAEARGLETDALRAVSSPKRYTLLICLVYQAQVLARDQLVEIFLKRMNAIRNRAEEELGIIREKQRMLTERMVSLMAQVVDQTELQPEDGVLGQSIRQMLVAEGGTETLRQDCEAILAYRDNNYFPLVYRFFASHRKTLFRLVTILDIQETSPDNLLLRALRFIQQQQDRAVEWFDPAVELDFASEKWQQLIITHLNGQHRYQRRHLETCVFTHLATELRSGELYVKGAEDYADYREQLVPWVDCEPLVAAYCQTADLPATGEELVQLLQKKLEQAAQTVDLDYPHNDHWYFNKHGQPVLRRGKRQAVPPEARELRRVLLTRMPQRSLLDVLCNVQHWINFTRHFGPLSGADRPRKKSAIRYILTTFGYGCNLGPTQTARHLSTPITPRILSFINRQHISTERLNAAITDIINHYSRFDLPRFWGSGRIAAADGTQVELYHNNLLAERHIRYGGYGGIAYHHVSDTYIALFSHFIACGVWEAVYIIDGLLKNASEIKPKTLHADTQGQSEPVFGLAYLLGIQLMPRIRNWRDLTLYRPTPQTHYQHIDALFSGTIDWSLIRDHWQDLMQVVLSIQAGKVLPSMLLRKLGTYSRKNRLYRAFRELGRVVRTIFLLNYINSLPLRQQITAVTNKVESYNGFVKWIAFGGYGVIAHNDPLEQEKRIKYMDLMANAIILQNVADMTTILQQLQQEGFTVNKNTLAILSPYLTEHLRRFGHYVVEFDKLPPPLQFDMPLFQDVEL